MPPSPIPAPLPPWARTLLQLAPFINAALQEALQYFGEMHSASAATPDTWRRFSVRCLDPTDLDAGDAAFTTFDVVNITNGAIDNTWTDTDYVNVVAPMELLLSQYCGSMPSRYKFDQIRAYRMQFNDLGDTHPFVKSGPPERVWNVNHPGTALGGVLPPQVSATSTDKTPYPKHWGRNYWPHPSPNTLGTTGHFTPAFVDALATAVETFYGSISVNELFPVVAVTQVDKVATRGLLQVTSLQVDDNPDVIRRRRFKRTTYRKTLP